jgi:8-hydroxy-5-deazaflavin:NADPH oxidoreductase
VIVGSRDADKAREAALQLTALADAPIEGASNTEAARSGDIVVVTVPWGANEATLAEIRAEVQGKIVVDTTVPLVPPKVMRVQLPPDGSAAMRTQRLLGEGVRVVAAFHNVAAHKLAKEAIVECDVLVFGDQKEARESVIELATAAGLRGIHGGALPNSAAAEALTSVLIFINKTYRVDGAGLRISGELQPLDS